MTFENDARSTPGMSRAVAGEIPDAVVEIVPHLRHLGLVERPMLFAQRIEAFLGVVA